MPRVYVQPDPPLPVPRYTSREGLGLPGTTDVIGRYLGSQYQGVDPEVVAFAGERGSRVHAAIGALLTGADDRTAAQHLLPGDLPYFDAARRLLRLVEFKPRLVEHRVVVEGAAARGLPGPYGMTVDAVGLWNGRPTIPDWKCRAVRPEGAEPPDPAGAQTAAYEDGLRRLGLISGGAWRRCVVELRRNGTYKVHWRTRPTDLDSWGRALWEWYRQGPATTTEVTR